MRAGNMLPWLGPDVAAAPFAWRAAAYTSLWVGHWFLVQNLVWAVLTAYQRLGWLKKNTREPALPLWHMLTADVVGYYSWACGAGIVHAWCARLPGAGGRRTQRAEGGSGQGGRSREGSFMPHPASPSPAMAAPRARASCNRRCPSPLPPHLPRYNPTWESWDFSFPYVRLVWMQLPILMVGFPGGT